MASINTKTNTPIVELPSGGIASHINSLQRLNRLVMSCLLWEDNAYEDGVSIAEMIAKCVHEVTPQEAAEVAIRARNEMHLRHVPLLVVREIARHKDLSLYPRIVINTMDAVIQRPDELSEFLAIYWKDGKCPLSAQVKKGLAKAFGKFKEYSLSKYNRKKDIMLRDVFFLSHAKPKDLELGSMKWDKKARSDYHALVKTNEAHAAEFLEFTRPNGFSEGELLFGRVANEMLTTPDTWEVELSAGKDKQGTFIRLMAEDKLGDMAFLRNLRNMVGAGVPENLMREYGNKLAWSKVLPFRFLAAAKHAPRLEPHIETWMMKSLETVEKLKGSTLLVVDVSGSMHSPLSAKSELNRLDAAAALAALAREICEDPVIYLTAGYDETMAHKTELIPARRGFALMDYARTDGCKKLGGGGIFLAQCMNFISDDQPGRQFDRVMVFTDEQDVDRKLNPETAKLLGKQNYMINIASHTNGIGYKRWTHINGFSEAVIDFIRANESEALQ
jgi:hypothetical protein